MGKTIGKVLSAVLLAALVMAPPRATAVDFSYTGELDPETGNPVTAAEETVETNLVQITDGCFYNREARLFVYPVGSGINEVRSSVADGMVVSEPVRVTGSEGLVIIVTRNGEQIENGELANLNTAGEYVVFAKDGDTTERLFTFRVVGSTSPMAGGYAMPEGFSILDATVNEEDAYYERGYISMTEEGAYSVEYVCQLTGEHYTLVTTVDRTPPQLTFEGKTDEQGRFHSAVDVRGLERDDTVVMTRDGESVRFPADGHLPESGVYTLEAFDSAGNSEMYQFTILIYFDLNSLVFFSLVLLAIVGVAGYLIYKRRSLKVA